MNPFLISIGDDLLKSDIILRRAELRLFDLDRVREKKDKKGDNGNKKSNNHPLGICPRCKKLKYRRKHHGWPQWIDKRLKILGLAPKDVENSDFDDLCDDCHEEIEEINRKFEAVRMEECKSAMLEMRDCFISGEAITDDYIVAKARSIGSLRIAEEQDMFEAEVIIETIN
ncbi:MAG: hypothetical protein WA091_00685 [Minisyncoccales bacterium]